MKKFTPHSLLPGLCISLTVLTGCASVSAINRNYARINYDNGINQDEAKLIAKHHLIQTDLKYAYRVIHPNMVGPASFLAMPELATLEVPLAPSPDRWIVSFAPKMSVFPFPFLRTRYAVAVDKKTGEIRSAGQTSSLMQTIELVLSLATLTNTASPLFPATLCTAFYTDHGRWPHDTDELAKYVDNHWPQIRQEDPDVFKDFTLATPSAETFVITKRSPDGKPLPGICVTKTGPPNDFLIEAQSQTERFHLRYSAPAGMAKTVPDPLFRHFPLLSDDE